MRPDEPNVTIPLAISYNERGVAGYTVTVTNATDQRKINSMYDLAQNAITGKPTLYLTKRQGVTESGQSLGTANQVGYLISVAPGASVTPSSLNQWVFSTSGNDIRASSSTTTTVIATAAGYVPAFVDTTEISGAANLLLQLRNASFAQTAWYSTAIGTFTQITDTDFTGLTPFGKMESLGGWTFVLDTTNRIYNSDPNSLANWTSGQYKTKNIRQDAPVGLAKLGQQIIAFGRNTFEVFRNTGQPSASPLSAVPELAQDTGMESQVVGQTHYYAKVGGRIYWFGRRGGLRGDGVFSWDGARVEKVSTPFIDKIIANAPILASVNACAIKGQEAVAIQLSATTAATQIWLMFFPRLNEWFEWNSTIFTPVNSGTFYLGVGANQHKIYSFDAAVWQDDSTNYAYTHQFLLPSNGNHRKFMPMCGVKGDTARSALSLGVEFSDDDWQTFSTVRNIDMTSQQKMLTRCGSYHNRGVRLSYTGSLEVRLEAFLARIA